MNAHAAIGIAEDERLEIVQSGDRLAEIGSAWTQLWQRTDGLIFQSHAWISAWWNTVPDRDSRSLRIGLVWSGDALVAVLPLAISRRKGLLMLEWAANAHSDYEDVLRGARMLACRSAAACGRSSQLWAASISSC